MILGFSQVDFSNEELFPIQAEQKFHEIGMSGVVAELLASGEVKLKVMPEINFDATFCNSLEHKEIQSYLNSVVRELGWRAMASKAHDDNELEYIKYNLSCLDFEIRDRKRLYFKDFSGRYKSEDPIVRATLEEIEFYVRKFSLLDFLIAEIGLEDDLETENTFDIRELVAFLSSGRRQEQRIAQLLYALLKSQNYNQRVQVIETYRDRAKFANSTIDFLKSMVIDSGTQKVLELHIAKNISRMYNACYWPNRIQFLYALAFYLRDFHEVAIEIQRLLFRYQSFPIVQHRGEILKVLKSEVDWDLDATEKVLIDEIVS